MPRLAENPMKICWLVPEIHAVEGLQKNIKQRKVFLSIGFILKSIFARSDLVCLITLHINTFSNF